MSVSHYAGHGQSDLRPPFLVNTYSIEALLPTVPGGGVTLTTESHLGLGTLKGRNMFIEVLSHYLSTKTTHIFTPFNPRLTRPYLLG